MKQKRPHGAHLGVGGMASGVYPLHLVFKFTPNLPMYICVSLVGSTRRISPVGSETSGIPTLSKEEKKVHAFFFERKMAKMD